MGHLLSHRGLIIILLAAVSLAFAGPDQKQPEQDKQDMGGLFDFASMQNKAMDIFQKQLDVTDEEWTVIRPRLTKVMELNQALEAMASTTQWNTIAKPLINQQMQENQLPEFMSQMITQFSERMQQAREKQAQNDAEQQHVFRKAVTELQETLDKEAPSSAEIKAKMAAVRGAKEKTEQELAKAKSDLKEILTVKQEAKMLLMGILD